jgi:hypothetical protein
MGYLIFLLGSLVLFGGFLALTAYESRRGARIAEHARASLDARVDRIAFIATHVDFPAYLRDLVRVLAARIAHDVIHAGLVTVRFLERVLTRAVRALRAEQATLIEAERQRQTSDFVAQMRDFKDELRSARRLDVIEEAPESTPDIY